MLIVSILISIPSFSQEINKFIGFLRTIENAEKQKVLVAICREEICQIKNEVGNPMLYKEPLYLSGQKIMLDSIYSFTEQFNGKTYHYEFEQIYKSRPKIDLEGYFTHVNMGEVDGIVMPGIYTIFRTKNKDYHLQGLKSPYHRVAYDFVGFGANQKDLFQKPKNHRYKVQFLDLGNKVLLPCKILGERVLTMLEGVNTYSETSIKDYGGGNLSIFLEKELPNQSVQVYLPSGKMLCQFSFTNKTLTLRNLPQSTPIILVIKENSNKIETIKTILR